MTNYSPINELLILEEYKACRERISKEIDAINTLETTVFIACGAIFSFGASQTVEWFRFCCVTISFIGLYGLWKYHAHRRIIRIHESYIDEEIEDIVRKNVKIDKVKGLIEHYNENKSKKISDIGRESRSGYLKYVRFAFWGIIIIIPMLAIVVTACDKTFFGLLKVDRTIFDHIKHRLLGA